MNEGLIFERNKQQNKKATSCGFPLSSDPSIMQTRTSKLRHEVKKPNKS